MKPDETSDDANTGDRLEPGPEGSMSLFGHLEELRWTLVKSLAVFIVGFAITAVFMKDFSLILDWPLNLATRDTPDILHRITSTPLAIFSVIVMVCFIGALTFSLPFILYFFGKFVAPALTERERRLLIPAGLASIVLFIAGVLFAYFLLVPSVIRVAIYTNNFFGAELFWTIDKYYSMVVWMLLGMGTAFQFPMVLQALVYLEVVTPDKLRSWRRITILLCVIVSAIITPTPDPLTLFIVAIPLILLYEVAIWVGATFTLPLATRWKAELAEDDDPPDDDEPPGAV